MNKTKRYDTEIIGFEKMTSAAALGNIGKKIVLIEKSTLMYYKCRV